MNHKLMSTTLAVAAALAFAVVPMSSAVAAGKSHHVKCYGVNACKGKGACKSDANACKGKNSCKGKGIKMEKNDAACTKAGGTVESPKEEKKEEKKDGKTSDATPVESHEGSEGSTGTTSAN